MADIITPRTDNTTTPGGEDSQRRFDLAKWIIVFTLAIIALFAYLAITVVAGDPHGFANIKELLSILLPVLSAWVGAVIAFYFGRENFESGTRSSAALVTQLTSEQKLKAVPARDVMIPIEKAAKFTLPGKDQEGAVKIKADLIDGVLEKAGRERLPILLDGRICYIGHRSLFDKYLVQHLIARQTKATETNPPTTAPATPAKELTDLTLKDMLDDAKFGDVLRGGFKCAPTTATLAQIKPLMTEVKICNDVFLTEDGSRTTKVLGWVTNIIVEEQGRV